MHTLGNSILETTTLFLGGEYIPGGHYVTSSQNPQKEFVGQLRRLPGFAKHLGNTKDEDVLNALIHDHGLIILQGEGSIATVYSESGYISWDKEQARLAFSLFSKPDGVIHHGTNVQQPTEPVNAAELFHLTGQSKTKKAAGNIVTQASEILAQLNLPDPEATIRNLLRTKNAWKYNSAAELAMGAMLNTENPAYKKSAITAASILRSNPGIQPEAVIKTLLAD